MKLILSVFLLFIIGQTAARSQVMPAPSPVVLASPVPSMVPAPLESPAPVVVKVAGLFDHVPSSLPTWLLAILGLITELCMRIWPTVRPRSIFILAGQLFSVIGTGLIKISNLLDLIVQQTKDPDKKA